MLYYGVPLSFLYLCQIYLTVDVNMINKIIQSIKCLFNRHEVAEFDHIDYPSLGVTVKGGKCRFCGELVITTQPYKPEIVDTTLRLVVNNEWEPGIKVASTHDSVKQCNNFIVDVCRDNPIFDKPPTAYNQEVLSADGKAMLKWVFSETEGAAILMSKPVKFCDKFYNI